MLLEQVKKIVTAFQAGQTQFQQVSLRQADFQAAHLPFIDFEKAILQGVNMSHATLSGANFQGAMLEQGIFKHVNFLGADLSWANLSQATLDHALCSTATLVGVDLSNATLAGANLAYADLRSANLRNANLIGANLKGTNLSQANLFGARVDLSSLSDAVLDHTVLPNGSCYSESGGSSSQVRVPVENYLSYSRIARSLTYARKAVLLEKTKVPENEQALAESNPAIPEGVVPPQSESVKPLRVGFRFSENVGDLVLTLASPESPSPQEIFIPFQEISR